MSNNDLEKLFKYCVKAGIFLNDKNGVQLLQDY